MRKNTVRTLLVLTLSLAPALASGQECDVRDFGARGDGRSKDTAAIQAAIDQCSRQGGAVVLRKGVFLSGMIQLRSNIELRIEQGATLKGSMEDSDYPDTQPPTSNSQLSDAKKTLVYAESADHVTIDGGGTIDGSGANPNWTGRERTRPMGIFLALSTNISIHDITVKNAGMWGVVLLETDHAVLRRLTVSSPYHPNRDGIDIVDGHHTLIEDTTILSDDDSLCLKSGSARGVYDLTARNVHILRSNANGIKFGSASTGFFSKILFEKIDLTDVNDGAIAIESVDGARIENVRFRDIQFKNAGTAFYIILGRRFLSASVGSIDGISFEQVSGTVKYGLGSAISGTAGLFSTYTVRNISMTDVHVTNLTGVPSPVAEPSEYGGGYPDPSAWGVLPAYGLYLRHVSGVRLVNTSFTPVRGEGRPPLLQNDVTDFSSR